MQLSLHADYALRTLLYLGAYPNETIATKRISEAYGISRNHLVRVVQTLAETGYVQATAGRTGGIRLAKSPDQIRLGQVVRDAEPNLVLVECFDRATNTCPIAPACELKGILRDALEVFLKHLDGYTLEDLIAGRRQPDLVRIFTATGRQADSTSAAC